MSCETGQVLCPPYKNLFLAILAGVFFGPIGLLYFNWIVSVVMLAIFVFFILIPVQGMAVSIMIGLAIWVICIYWNAIGVHFYNKRLYKNSLK